VSGLVKESPYGPSFSDPLLEVLESTGSPVRSPLIGRLVPVYGLTEGLRADTLRRAIQAVLPHLDRWSDPLPETLRQRLALLPRQRALRGIHQPTDQADLQASRRRLVFDEFLLLQLGLQSRDLLVAHPVDAVHRTGVDRFLDPFGAVAVLPKGTRTAPVGFHHEGMSGHMGAVAAADADRLIHPHRFLPQDSTKQRL